MLRYHVAFDLPHARGEMVAPEALDFPGAVTPGFALPDARLMTASALEDLAQALLEVSTQVLGVRGVVVDAPCFQETIELEPGQSEHLACSIV